LLKRKPENVKSADDMAYLNYSAIDFRFNTESYPFVCKIWFCLHFALVFSKNFFQSKAQYRQKDLLEALALPLLHDDKYQPPTLFPHLSQNNLLFIQEFAVRLHGHQLDLKNKDIRHLLSEDKLSFILRSSYSAQDSLIKEYFKEITLNRQLDFKYKMGLTLNKFNWLLSVFADLSQTPNIHSVLCKFLNKLLQDYSDLFCFSVA
jgi:hypothetical protein